jgi:metal-dependent amidase/aminoacylase/carboxypeptidase family protein
MPHDARDPVLAAASLVVTAQQIVSRNTNPTTPAVVSFGGIVSNSNVPNVIPESVQLCGTCRTYSDAVRLATEQRLKQLCEGTAISHGVKRKSSQFVIVDFLFVES